MDTSAEYHKQLLERSPVADFTLTAPKPKARRGKVKEPEAGAAE